MTPSTHDHAHGFGLDHLPYGVFSVDGGPRRVGVRRGDEVLDLLCELQREAKLTMIIATHDDRVAARAHATLRLADGLIA